MEGDSSDPPGGRAALWVIMRGQDRVRSASLLGLALLFSATLPGLPAVAAVEAPGYLAETSETIYRLSEKASYVKGCFPPCYCPIWVPAKIVGTLVLGAPVLDGALERREVREVNWTASYGDESLAVTGSGSYLVERQGDDVAQSLELDLSTDGQAPEHFFSGMVPLEGADDGLDIAVSMNGMFCHDVVIEVHALPVPTRELLDYELSKSSSYQEGCFLLCDCLLLEPQPMSGHFTLVPVENLGTVAVFTVSGVDFSVHGTGSGGSFELTGFGTYTLIQGFAGPFHILQMRLSRDGGDAELYDHAENTAPTFPGAIDIELDQNDRVCFDRVLSLHGVLAERLWHDGFESGDTDRWSRCSP